MAWTDSRIFVQAVLNPLTATTAGTSNITLPTGYSTTGGILTDAILVALYNSSVTPDRNAALASTAYAAGTWSGNEVTGTNWAAGGQTLGTKTYGTNVGGNVGTDFDAADISVSNVTLAGFFGDLTYDNNISAPTAKQGLCFHYYGGTQSVTAGNLTIIWDATGVFRFTV